MWPRKKLDIGWFDLAVGIALCCWPASATRARQRLEAFWQSDGDGIIVACLSVRTGFDLLLTALALPVESEVIFSAVNIRDMVRIVRQHGLVPVPVDLDMDTLAVDAADIERLVTPRTRVIVVAHLFGSRMPLDAIGKLAATRGLLLVEDCAQAYSGNVYRGDPDADVRMFSFGPIKTNTALGGALLSFRDRRCAAAVRAREAMLPPQRRAAYCIRLLKYAVLKTLLWRPVFTMFVTGCRAVGRNHDDVISGAVRGFAGPDFFARVRRQPCYPLLSLLHRRLARFDPEGLAAREKNAQNAIAILGPLCRPGCRASFHSHWVFPMQALAPDALIARLWRAGFDATRGASSLHVLLPASDSVASRPQRAERALSETVYLPIYPGMSRRAVVQLARHIDAFTATYGGGSPKGAAGVDENTSRPAIPASGDL